MFANALAWVREWALKRIVRDYILKPLTSRGGPGCPPLAPATPDSSDALAFANPRVIVPKTDHLLKRDLAWAAMVESLRPSRERWDGYWIGVDLAKCTIPLKKGWTCSRGAGHDGPCAARLDGFMARARAGDGLSRRSTESERSEAPCAPYRGPLGLNGGWKGELSLESKVYFFFKPMFRAADDVVAELAHRERFHWDEDTH